MSLRVLNTVGEALVYRSPSFGTFSTSLDPVYSFGIPRDVEMSGILVDMDVVAQSLWAKNNDAQTSRIIGQQTGVMTSAFEYRIPELFFTNEENPGEAMSAVKALALAAQQGQRVYQVTSANVGALDGLSIGEEVKDEIRAAVAVGREATVSAGTITVAGWTGVGYIISDPETGAGAYRISGGLNGGFFEFLKSLFKAVFWWIAVGPAVGFLISIGIIANILPIALGLVIVAALRIRMAAHDLDNVWEFEPLQNFIEEFSLFMIAIGLTMMAPTLLAAVLIGAFMWWIGKQSSIFLDYSPLHNNKFLALAFMRMHRVKNRLTFFTRSKT